MANLLKDHGDFDRLVPRRVKVSNRGGEPHQTSKPMRPGECSRLRADGVLDPVLWTLREILLDGRRAPMADSRV
jgi:hypothetical protein